MGRGFENWGSWVLKIQQTKQVGQEWWYHPQNFYLTYANLSISENSPLWKCSHLIFLYIIGYNNISRRPHDPYDPSTPNSGVATPSPRIDVYGLNLRPHLWQTSALTAAVLCTSKWPSGNPHDIFPSSSVRVWRSCWTTGTVPRCFGCVTSSTTASRAQFPSFSSAPSGTAYTLATTWRSSQAASSYTRRDSYVSSCGCDRVMWLFRGIDVTVLSRH